MRKKISLHDLMTELFDVPAPPFVSNTKVAAKPTTIRPSPQVANFYEFHANRLGISMQDMISLTITAVANASSHPVETEFQLAVSRFKHIFEAHNIPQIHAKHVIDSYDDEITFPLAALANEKILLENFTPSVKQSISRIFGVREDWLSGTGKQSTIANPIISRDYAYSVFKDLTTPVKLNNIAMKNHSLLLVKSESDLGLDIDGKEYPFEVLLFITYEWQLDKHMSFNTLTLAGAFPLANQEARICLQALLVCVGKLTNPLICNGASYSQESIIAVKNGLLPADCFKKGFPSLWDTRTLFPDDNNADVNLLVSLLMDSSQYKSDK